MLRSEHLAAGPVHGFIVHADRPRGGIVILPTITAVDRFMQERAQGLAASGISVLVWNPYPGEEPPADVQTAMGRAAKLRDDAVDDMAACVAHLRQATGGAPVGVLGFCLGGRYALLLAAQERGLAACVAFYPSVFVPPKPNQARDAVALSARIACPVHLVYGTADEVLTHAAFLQLRGALEQRAAATIVQVHPGAVHSFMRPELQGNPANAAATRLAWPQAEAFLAAQLARS